MSASLLHFLKSTPPAPRVVLLPDSCFFTRTIPIEQGATPEQVTGQIELAMETLSPFAFAKLYRGYYWIPGESHALVFAAYRKRFAQDQVDSWTGVEWVAPTFCAVLGLAPKESCAVLYQSDDSVTAVQWADSRIPSRILVRPLPTEATPEQVAQTRETMLADLGSVHDLIELETAPAIIPSMDEESLRFQGGSHIFDLSRSQASVLDVRPADELEVLRSEKRRELMLWRSAVGLCAAILLLCIGEIALGAGWAWQKARKTQVQSQSPVVEGIMTANSLSMRIDELATKRLLPFEMITVLSEKKPRSIQFVRTTTDGLLRMKVEAQTPNAGDIVTWQTDLAAQPAIALVEIPEQRAHENQTRFTLIANFKAEGLKPE